MYSIVAGYGGARSVYSIVAEYDEARSVYSIVAEYDGARSVYSIVAGYDDLPPCPNRSSSSSPNAQARHPQLDWGSIYLDTNRAHRSQISLIRWVTLLILQALSRTAHTKNQSTRNAHLDTRSESGMTEREVCTHPLPGMTTFHYVIPDRLTVIPNRPASSSPT